MSDRFLVIFPSFLGRSQKPSHQARVSFSIFVNYLIISYLATVILQSADARRRKTRDHSGVSLISEGARMTEMF